MTVIQGIVEHGDERGRTLGFPTANIQLFDNQAEDGVWAAVIRTDSGKPWLAAVSIGRRQTFYAQTGNKLLEAHLLDFNDDLYGRQLTVTLTAKLRDQQTFSTINALTEQLHHDVTATRNWAQQHYRWLVSPGSHENGAAIWPLPRTLAAAQ
ncbi:RNA-binding riboflavin kinase RibR [Arthrobacter sp. Bi83]|jgi:riboflavin kinase/FMN adenylyltransferase|uniref:riboflavin kinase n=1 Tax=Arthrobacter sp. Bi83 TaxID=2822353 RepID=UPI001DD11EA7|nr:riboflavin kinase [Arthrobacter sp. Bi83]CAH0178574.1 RNA-binding riboflavin kinase RibR [Arthrobacter sp. Bi83]